MVSLLLAGSSYSNNPLAAITHYVRLVWKLNKMAGMLQMTFCNAFSGPKMFVIFLYWSVSQLIWLMINNIGSGDSLVTIRSQAITWNTVDQVSWRGMASLGHNALIHVSLSITIATAKSLI